MNLKEYFKKQQENNISDESKMIIYHKFLEKKSRTPVGILKKLTTITKLSTYSLAMIICSIVLFGLIDNDTSNLFNNSGFQVTSSNPTGYRASADSIAIIKKFEGGYELKDQEGNSLQTNMVKNGDTIRLAKAAYIEADIEGNKTKIFGPATIVLEKQENGETIMNVQGGTFVEVITKETSQNLAIVKNDVTITKANTANENMKIQIIENKEGITVKNYGDSISVTNKQQNTTINNKQQLTIKNDTTPETAKQETTEQHPAANDNNSWEKVVDFIEQNTENQEKTPTDNSLQMEKKVPTPEQLVQIEGLKTSVLSYYVKNLLQADIQENQQQYNIALQNIHKLIKNIGDSFGIEVIDSATLTNIQANNNKLRTELQNQYYIPPSFINRLITLDKWLGMMATGIVSNQESKDIAITELIHKLEQENPLLKFT